jgi:hypothetical protein
MSIFGDMDYFMQDESLYGKSLLSSVCEFHVKFNFRIEKPVRYRP